ncbi:hypothetical protein GOB25_31780 [Sinorhizobium meliloti]|nr:hypothetical protein [Sinorhizobium meliloti]
MISSRNILSIVFPFYGNSATLWPDGLGVHEWQNHYWHMLSAQLVEARLALRPASVLEVRDFR